MANKGRFTLEEQRFILENKDTLPIAEMAASMKRQARSITDWLRRNDLKSANVKSVKDRDMALRKKLYAESFFEEVKSQLSPEELNAFTKNWISITKQFNDDILPSEKLSLKKFLILEAMHDRSSRLQNTFLTELEKKRIEIAKEKGRANLNYKKINSLAADITDLNNKYNNAVKQTLDINREQSSAQKTLKISRDQRIERITNAKESWGKAMEEMDKDSVRADLGMELEILRAAKENAKIKLMKYHSFIDNKLDNPVLCDETFEVLEELDRLGQIEQEQSEDEDNNE